MTLLLREILTVFLPQSLWHLAYFHMPSDTEEPEPRWSEVSCYPGTGQLLLGHVLLDMLMGAFLAGHSLQVV